jgi:hypothetical protein
MRLKSIILLSTSIGLFLLLSGCGGSSGVRVTEGNQQVGAAPTGSVFASTEATVVHVDLSERLATLRFGRDFSGQAFLETRDSQGNKTGLLKTRDNRSVGLRTADILEGEPAINNRASLVSPEESRRLGQIYTDAINQ